MTFELWLRGRTVVTEVASKWSLLVVHGLDVYFEFIRLVRSEGAEVTRDGLHFLVNDSNMLPN